MGNIIKASLTLILILSISAPVYAYNEADISSANTSSSFPVWLNTRPQQRDENREKTLIREQWKDTLGVDVFYPYFKVKEIEHKATERTSISVFKIKGKAQVTDDSIKYIFRIKF